MSYRVCNKYIALSLFCLASASCTDQMTINKSDGIFSKLTLEASYPCVTRVSDSGFEDGDEMGVYVLDYLDGVSQSIGEDNINASNVKFKFHATDNSWIGENDIYWRDAFTPADIVAYYPSSRTIIEPEEFLFSVEKHQENVSSDSEKGGYEKSDFLWGCTYKQMPTSQKVQLTLNHLMAGVMITLQEGSGFSKGEWESLSKQVLLANVALDGVINLGNGSVKADETQTSTESIVPMEVDGMYRAVVFPQTKEAGSKLLAITVGSDGYELEKKESIIYESGKLHTFTITVDKKQEGGIECKIVDEGIMPWMDDAEFREGIIRSYTVVNVPERGTLKDVIVKMGLSLSGIVNLKIIGEINEEDFYFIRDELISLKSLHLKDVTVYEGERKDVIPQNAMYEKSTLNRVIFPKDLKIIGSSAFFRCGLMGDLIIPEGVVKIGEGDNEENFNVGDYSNSLFGAFAYCQNLLGNLELPSTLLHIEPGAFNFAEFEGNLILPESLEYVGAYAFNRNNFTGELILPASLRYIGPGAFSHTKFTGSLEIPDGISVVNQSAFQGAKFSGSLLLPESVKEIQIRAFDDCEFRGELLLPSSLTTLGDYAFCNTKISSIVFPENLTSIGKGCFMNCSHLNSKITIPSKVTRINEYSFSGIPMLSDVEMHENVTFVGGGAFAGDYNLSKITVKNPTPPLISIVKEWDYESGLIEKDPFYGIPLGNLTLQVPEDSREEYARAELWKNIGKLTGPTVLDCKPIRLCALNSSLQESVIVDCEGEWEVSHIPSWCKISSSSGIGKSQLTVTISEMVKGTNNREDYIEFRMKGTNHTSRCNINQYDYEYYADECIVLQSATKGKGIDILFIGDGFNAESIVSGDYLKTVNEQMQAFFDIEPYSTYRDRFNVYVCISLSQESGVSTTNTRVNTKFNTRYDNGTGCSVKGLACNNPEEVFDYAVAHSPLNIENMKQSLIIMALNSDQYGSVTTLTENGSAIAIVGKSSDPYPMDSRGILQHEACGHAFGKLGEERILKNQYASDAIKTEIEQGYWRGWYQNISLTGKLNEVSWSQLIFDPRYSDKVDVFEGGYGFTRGVYRAEINSCMNYGIPYFSAPARLDIMRRILEYSGEGFTMEKFYATDSDKWGSTGTTRAALPDASNAYVNSGMHHPVRIVKSKKY